MFFYEVGKWIFIRFNNSGQNLFWLTSVIFATYLFVIGWWMICGWRVRKQARNYINKIPGPFGLPIIGNTFQLNVDHSELFQRIMGMRLLWGRQEGINKAWLGQNPYIFVSKASTVEPILGSNRHVDKSSDYRFLQPWLGTGLLTGSGNKWYARRKILTPSFHFNILEEFIDVFGEQTDILVEKMGRELGSRSFNIFSYVTLCTLDIICETAMGRKIHAQDDFDSDYVRAVYEIGNIIQTRQAKIWYHPDILFRFSSLYDRHQKCIKTLHAFSKKVISERRREIEEKHKTSEGNIDFRKRRLAFLDLLIEASQRDSSLTDDDIREEVDTFMFEGHDTTSSAVCWTLYLLGCHPEIQDKVIDEINTIYEGRVPPVLPTFTDLRNMKYLEMCIKETLRLYPSVPLLARRIASDVCIGKYVVPKGTTAMIVVPMLHRDPYYFPHPEKFDPDRFSAQNSTGRHPYAYIPFSAGPRNCIGQKFALLEEKAIISGLLRRYIFEATERRENILLTAELVTRAKDGLRVRIQNRY